MKILAVDDHEELLELVVRALNRDGHQCEGVTSGEQALPLLARQTFDLLILDLALPSMSGEEVCRTVRSRGATPAILILTAKSAVASRVHCLDLGADDYLVKPFAVAELRARVRALGRRFPSQRPADLRKRDLLLCFSTRQAYVQSQEAPITAREWAILERLASALDNVVSRKSLLDALWPGNPSAGSSLDVLIGRLRKKLGPSVIKTVRGEGYVLMSGHEPDEPL